MSDMFPCNALHDSVCTVSGVRNSTVSSRTHDITFAPRVPVAQDSPRKCTVVPPDARVRIESLLQNWRALSCHVQHTLDSLLSLSLLIALTTSDSSLSSDDSRFSSLYIVSEAGQGSSSLLEAFKVHLRTGLSSLSLCQHNTTFI